MLFSKHHKYTLIQEKNKENRGTSSRPYLMYITLSFLLASIPALTGVFGFVLGNRTFNTKSAATTPDNSSSLELQTLTQSFRYNRSFTEAPSPHTDHAWRAMFPIDGGFFAHPIVAPTRSTFSAFHQLHCLNGLRGAYWIAHNAAIRGEKLIEEDVPMDMRPRHVRHCIDLLRQSLMCHADTTVEVVDEDIGGVHGFRTEHWCRDWEQLVMWTSAQQRKERG